MFFDSKQSAPFAMKDFGSLVVGVLLVMSILHSAGARRDSDPSRLKTTLNFLPAIRYSDLSEKACFTPNATDGMYVAVPEGLFRRGNSCNKKLRVQCAEPYQDLGGPWNVCKNKKTFEVTVIDQVLYEPLDDDLFHLSEKAFWAMANPSEDTIRIMIHK